MSGVKHATVQRKLDQALNALDEQIAILEQAVDRRGQLGRNDYLSAKKKVLDAYRRLNLSAPADIADFIKQELQELQKKYQAIGVRIEHANKTDQAFTNAENQAKGLIASAKRSVVRLQEACHELEHRIAFRSGYLDSENREAQALRSQANRTRDDSQNALRFQDSAIQSMVSAHAEFLSIGASCHDLSEEFNRLLGIGNSRMTAHKIAEEEKRKAFLLQNELETLAASIRAGNPDKFIPGRFDENKVQVVLTSIAQGNYRTALQNGENLPQILQSLLKEEMAAKQAWIEAKNTAELTVNSCLGELKMLDKQFLLTYSRQPVEKIDALFTAAEQLNVMLTEERFAEAKETAEFILEALRKFGADAQENKSLYEERQKMAEVLMQVLYDSNYAPPEAGFAKGPDGTLDKFGALHIFAKSPGGLADVKMQINIDGQVRWEMDNVPDGQEGICLASMQEVYQRAGELGVDFQVTDLGRAAGYQGEKLPNKGDIAITREHQHERN